MTAVLENQNLFYLALVFLGALGLGAGLSLGKGGALLAKLKGDGEKVSVSVTSPAPPPENPGKSCTECLQNLAQLLPCKDHSGVVAGISHLSESNGRIEKRVDQVWGAIDEIRGDVKGLLKAGPKGV